MYISRIKIRLFAFFSSIILTFSFISADYLEVEALEWVGVAVGYDTALKFLLGLLGVSVGVGVANDIDWTQMQQDVTNIMVEQGASQIEASRWWNDVIHGSLDIASSCWDSFKDWASSLVSSSGSSDISSSEILSIIRGVRPSIVNISGIPDSISFKYAIYRIAQGGYFQFYFFDSNTIVSEINGYLVFTGNNYSNGLNSDSYTSLQFNLSLNSSAVLNRNYEKYYIFGLDSSYDSYFNDSTKLYSLYPWDIAGGIDSSFEALYPNIGDISLNPENADSLITDVIPIPWENIGVSEDAIQDLIDDAIQRVIDGSMSLENYWEYVQNITNTYAYSIENNYILPNENGEDKKADDKVEENAENSAFILYGLERVFPFCIPFDIYAFLTLLRADPVAPVIDFPIYNPINGENEYISIDFSAWESVVILFRYIFDFLLIIGLLLLARPLVGAGGDS